MDVFLRRRNRCNGYEVQMKDEGQYGKDRLRTHVLVALSAVRQTTVDCVVCSAQLTVFQDFPIVDGLFFESPVRYGSCSVKVDPLTVGGLHKTPITDASRFYLNAVCLDCLWAKTHRLVCKSCQTEWDSDIYVVGNVYLYDVFAAMSCCSSRLACKQCAKPACGDVCPKYYSEYSQLIACRHCRAEDYHYVKPLFDVYARVPK